jgi:hypothetical protein
VTRWLWQSQLVRLGLAAVCLSGALLTGVLITALRVDRVDGGGGSSPLLRVPPAPAPAQGYALDHVLTAVAKDPFHPERRRPGARFQLPAVRAAASARREASQAAEASLRLVGTAVSGNGGGFAMCVWQGGSPKIVRIGERVGDWTLHRILPGAAEFVTSAGGTITVHVTKAGA